MSLSKIVIVCGLPRSSTTMVQRLLNSHGHILVYDEFPLFAFPQVSSLVATYESFLAAPLEAWRRLSRDEIRSRQAELVVALWRLVSDPEKYGMDGTAARVIGMKTPGAERDFLLYDQIFEAYDLRYLYCVRHPCHVLASLSEMPWMPETEDMVGYVRDLYAGSYSKLRELEEVAPERVLVAQVDRVAGAMEDRLAFCRRILGFLAEEVTPGIVEFARKWPVVDHWARGRERCQLPDRWQVDFCRDPVIREIAERFGYQLAVPQ